MYLHLVVNHVERDIRHMQEVVGEILLDHVSAVSTADYEVNDAMRRIRLHDVPQDRMSADFDHRLGSNLRLFGKPRPHSPGKDHGLHESSPITGTDGSPSTRASGVRMGSFTERPVDTDKPINAALQIEVRLSQQPTTFGCQWVGEQHLQPVYRLVWPS